MSCHFLPQCSSAFAPFYGLPILQTHATAARIRSASSATAAAVVLGCQGSKFLKLPGHPKSHPGHTQVLGTPSCVSKSSQLLLLRIPLKLQQNVGKNGGEKKSKLWSESQTALGTKSPLPQDLNTCEHP